MNAGRIALLAFLCLVATCLPSPTKQAQDAADLIGCVTKDWGQPIEVIAHDCTQDAVQVAVDVVADISVLTKPASNPYAADPRVQASVARRAQASPTASSSASSSPSPSPSPSGSGSGK